MWTCGQNWLAQAFGLSDERPPIFAPPGPHTALSLWTARRGRRMHRKTCSTWLHLQLSERPPGAPDGFPVEIDIFGANCSSNAWDEQWSVLSQPVRNIL